MNAKQIIKAALFRPGHRKKRIIGGALKGMYFHFDLHQDTQEWRGIYEQSLQQWLQQHVKPGAVCLDIGAANGYFALLMAKLAGPQGHVYAFEPSAVNKYIEPNIALNADQALAPVKLFDDYVVGPGHEGDHKIAIDDLVVLEKLSHVDVVKIDVDGGELDVLEGMADTLTRFHPHLYIEVHSRELLAQVEAFVKIYDYRMRLEHPPAHEMRPLNFNAFLYSETH